jgi:hypothetical protein
VFPAKLPGMAKQIKCPLCGDKHQPDGPNHPNHIDPSTGSLCAMSTRPVDNAAAGSDGTTGE